MKQQTKSAVPIWYWVIAAVSLVWNLLGCVFFATELFAQEAFMEAMTEPQKEWVRSIPGWIYVVYGVAEVPSFKHWPTIEVPIAPWVFAQSCAFKWENLRTC